eukprot:Pgem_evm1s17372
MVSIVISQYGEIPQQQNLLIEQTKQLIKQKEYNYPIYSEVQQQQQQIEHLQLKIQQQILKLTHLRDNNERAFRAQQKIKQQQPEIMTRNSDNVQLKDF